MMQQVFRRVLFSLAAATLRTPAAAITDEKVTPHTPRHLQQQQQQARDALSGFLDTPIDQWTGEQWLVLLVLFIVVSMLGRCLCSCCGRRRRYYGGGGYRWSYYGGSSPYSNHYSKGGCCSCSDIFWCLCCFEWCCRDCQDVDACCDAGAGAVYQGGEMA